MNTYREAYEGALSVPFKAKSPETAVRDKHIRKFLRMLLEDEYRKWCFLHTSDKTFPERETLARLRQWWCANLEQLDPTTNKWDRVK